MFLRMLVRAAILRRGRAVSALFAMVVAAAVATAMLNLYVDVQAKLRREFRNYGANIILVGKNGASLPAETLAHVDSVLAGRGIRSAVCAWSWREPPMDSRSWSPARILTAYDNWIDGGR